MKGLSLTEFHIQNPSNRVRVTHAIWNLAAHLIETMEGL